MSETKNLLRKAFLIAGILLPVAAFAQGGRGITLLEPIGGVTEIPVDGFEGLGVMNYYLGLLYPWIVGMGAGVAVLMATWGGLEMIMAGKDPAGVTKAKERITMSIGGLLLVLLSATILHAINPVFFR